MRADIAPGGTFPDYELTDHTKTRRRLSELQGIDPMILVLSRGGFCPKDHQQHLQLAAHYPEIAVTRTRKGFDRGMNGNGHEDMARPPASW
ncbi:MAG: hypothetical protein ABSB01_03150 [Streptosporangiaceae bacterium]|jgi:peroxiredoxin